MIVRIVKMSFREEGVEAFLKLFGERCGQIRHFEGCSHLELWQESGHPNVYFTYSHWESEAHLNKYRFSPLFRDTWTQTKALFQDKPEAWSVLRHQVVG